MKPWLVASKLERIRNGAPPRVLDLFSGCGGLSLGFQAAGFTIAAAVEYDPEAARSHGANFHAGSPKHSVSRDIIRTTPSELALALGLGRPEEAFDVVVGGPPCQAFARVGRPKLREIEEHPEAFRRDPRARLYLHYLRYVEEIQPLVVLMENVPDVLNHGGQNIAQEICDVLDDKGYVCGYTLLNAAFYGVPQMRDRMFLLAYRREVADSVEFPAPKHWTRLPTGYEGTRAVALKGLRDSLFVHSSYRPAPTAASHLLPVVTARQAIGDLPPIDARRLLRQGILRRGTRRLDTLLPYPGPVRRSSYAHMMRTWPGFESTNGVSAHVIRYLPRDYELFSRMEAGDQYPEAHARALQMFDEELVKRRRRGCSMATESREYEDLKKSIVPPYDPGKFPNKWRKMAADEPARTLMAHLGKDSYSHIHYDCEQARTISVREAARLQSFPDGFVFCGAMNAAFRQIGNAVPPLMAKVLANEIAAALKNRVATSMDRLQMMGMQGLV